MNQNIANGDMRPAIDQPAHAAKGKEGIVQFGSFTVSVNGETENRFIFGARENAIGGARARVGGDEIEEGTEVGEAVGEGEGASHPFEGGVVVAKGVEGRSPGEDVEVVVGEGRVVVELRFEEVDQCVRG
ncbi:hypothetical protein SESBI_45389 [Sesbania bispinosa]|nr:hypothetical protein SESBI_45389 [Sesbania bispinosa]